jgi:hypothetical protein
MQSVPNTRPRQGLYIFERCTVGRRTLLFKGWYPEMVVFHSADVIEWEVNRSKSTMDVFLSNNDMLASIRCGYMVYQCNARPTLC